MGNRIFISYRRSDTFGTAGRLYDYLETHFGEENIFMDVDNIKPGADFVNVLDKAIADSDVLLVMIGDTWLDATDENNRRRLDNPEDFVRLEVEKALVRDILVLPVLVQGAHMPSSTELPDGLKPLARRQAIKVEHASFRTDVERLIGALDDHFSSRKGIQKKNARKRSSGDDKPVTDSPKASGKTEAKPAGKEGDIPKVVLVKSTALSRILRLEFPKSADRPKKVVRTLKFVWRLVDFDPADLDLDSRPHLWVDDREMKGFTSSSLNWTEDTQSIDFKIPVGKQEIDAYLRVEKAGILSAKTTIFPKITNLVLQVANEFVYDEY